MTPANELKAPRGAPRWRAAVPAIAALAGIVATIALGNWQTRRAEIKLALAAQWDSAIAAPVRELTAGAAAGGEVRPPARVRAHGRFRNELSVWLDNRMQDGRAGFWLVTPLDIGGICVLVNRGWAPRNPVDRAKLPDVVMPRGEVEVEGLALAEFPRLFELGRPAGARLPAIWQNFDLAAYREASGLRVASFVVEETGPVDDGAAIGAERPANDGLVRNWSRPDYGVQMHRGYALQWYAMAAMIAILALVVGLRRASARKTSRRHAP
ncbi:MAG TPA: SURF1 family protein [Burkholderiaceae bacterium]|nr:SURF1 family protein [Burkholderiaceae bacterium]